MHEPGRNQVPGLYPRRSRPGSPARERRARRAAREHPVAARRWPSLRDSWALFLGGVRVRAGQDQRLTTRANLRLAALPGVALSLTGVTVNELTVLPARVLAGRRCAAQ